jgi:HSP20 family molecular chaperone IbpA
MLQGWSMIIKSREITMFAQSIQYPTQNCTYATSFNPVGQGYRASWNGQPIVSSALLHNELLNKINSICAADFCGLNNQQSTPFAVNNGYGLQNGLAYNVHPSILNHAFNFGPLGLNNVAPVQHLNAIQQLYGPQGFGAVQGLTDAQACGMISNVSVIDNDTEVCFECACPGLTAKNIDVCIVHNEIRVRLISGSHTTTTKATGSRTTVGSASTGTCLPLCTLPLPSFCDANKCSARVEHGRLLITCPRTAEYVKNITRVKVS